ncbi:MAG: signal peptidase II [Casimicrobiaceae bacterium]
MVAGNPPNPHGLRWLWLSVGVIVADYATKAAMVAAFQPGEERPYTSFFSLILTFNSGAAFSMFANADGWQRWFFAIIAAAASLFIVWLLKRGGSAMNCAGLALILGGALGNLWDRLTIGRVVDFLLFHYQGWSWPAFNVADSAICVGAALLIVDSFRQRRAVDPDARATSGGGH